MARTMVYNFTMPQDKKLVAVKKNRTAAVEDVDEKKMKKNMFKINRNIFRVLKQVHPNISITCEAMKVMNTIINNMMLKLVHKSFKHNNSLRRNKSKLSINDIMSAVKEVFPPQMANLARTAARKALTNSSVARLSHKMDGAMSINDINDSVTEAFPPQMASLARAAAREALTDHRVSELSAIMDQAMSIK
ncbi:histone H2B.1-like [Trifolium pratense]|uniref:histone H2B.1-like n=1 Tax=Trifolium pratense TaxID=57577 RepID=UPI001E694176|nr:histone H2B.1-like [Trifolium pratense]